MYLGHLHECLTDAQHAWECTEHTGRVPQGKDLDPGPDLPHQVKVTVIGGHAGTTRESIQQSS